MKYNFQKGRTATGDGDHSDSNSMVKATQRVYWKD